MSATVPPDMLTSAALVVAHPDDEALWFSSIAAKVGRVIVCFLEVDGRPEVTAGRRAVAARFPLPNTDFLGVKESAVWNGADWLAPVTTDYGLEVARRPQTLRSFCAERYRENYAVLREHLRTRLQTCRNVFTHNPWGEYAHEEHVQVHRAVASLRPTLGFDLWYGNYCSNKSHALMLRAQTEFRSDYVTLATDRELAARLEALYREHGCWTWPYDDYEWFTHECFLRAKDTTPDVTPTHRGHLFPLNYLRVEAPWDEPSAQAPGLAARVARRLRAIGGVHERRSAP